LSVGGGVCKSPDTYQTQHIQGTCYLYNTAATMEHLTCTQAAPYGTSGREYRIPRLKYCTPWPEAEAKAKQPLPTKPQSRIYVPRKLPIHPAYSTYLFIFFSFFPFPSSSLSVPCLRPSD
jgi:hypothetical protein